ncbi:MAG: hypothetical protein LBE82_00365 [Chitinophagaceae bacterium]|jgi:hypothetical protein|nr:hypothetical protein [Chitinophagaceae bacterium]
MFQAIMVAGTIWVICFAIYKLFELFVRRKERMNIIEKLGDKLNASNPDLKLSIPSLTESANKFNTLKFACLLLGVGFGLLIGYLICLNSIPEYTTGNLNDNSYDAVSVIYGAGVLTGGGIGLLVAFLVEMNYTKRKSEKE